MRRSLCIMLMLCMILLPGSSAKTDAPLLTNIVVIDEGESLNLYFDLDGVATEKIKTDAFSGVTLEFDYTIRFFGINEFWFDKKISDLTIKRILKYQTKNNSFTVSFPSENENSHDFNSLEKAEKFICRVSGFKLCPTQKMEKDKSYRIRLKAIVRTNTEKISFVEAVSIPKNQETDWYSIEFIY